MTAMTVKQVNVKTAAIFFFAILSEVIATIALKFSEGFTKVVPAIIVVLGYGLSFYLLAISLRVLPIGLAYAIWSGVGIVLTVIAGAIIWHERLDWARVAGMALILAGILVINLYSRAAIE
jgi:small multidrug resistance pump